jgi:hypothetical protein
VQPVAPENGTVDAIIAISKTGIVKHIDFISRPQDVRSAIYQAVEGWTFQPFAEGEVSGQVTLPFSGQEGF